MQDLLAGVAGVDHRGPQLGERGRVESFVGGQQPAPPGGRVRLDAQDLLAEQAVQRATGESPRCISLLAFLRGRAQISVSLSSLALTRAGPRAPLAVPGAVATARRSDSMEVRSLS